MKATSVPGLRIHPRARSMVYKAVTIQSELNVSLTGTMFPLAPQEDALGILEHLR